MTDRGPATIRLADWQNALGALSIDPVDLIEVHATEDGIELVHVRRDLDGQGVTAGNRFATVTTIVGWRR